MQVGSLVTFRGSVGIVLGTCVKYRNKSDVWVQWNNEQRPKVESSTLLEVLCK